MTKLAWCSDIHLEFLDDNSVMAFARQLQESNTEGVLITGDISNSQRLIYHLSALERGVGQRIFFVLGNHDYWGSSLENVRKNMHGLHNVSQYLKYMTELSYVPVTPITAVVGDDGWYDANYGNWKTTLLKLNDWQNTHDFIQVGGAANVAAVVGVARKIAHEGTTHLMNSIKAAIRYHKHLIVITHVPPYSQLAGPAEGIPWFSNKYMGDMLTAAAAAYPNIKFTVLCGHSHYESVINVSANMTVRSAAATYGKPAIAGIIDAP
jgi:predicted phosphohydrolase